MEKKFKMEQSSVLIAEQQPMEQSSVLIVETSLYKFVDYIVVDMLFHGLLFNHVSLQI